MSKTTKTAASMACLDAAVTVFFTVAKTHPSALPNMLCITIACKLMEEAAPPLLDDPEEEWESVGVGDGSLSDGDDGGDGGFAGVVMR